MANEFETLDLKDENTGEVESFTAVDVTAREQISELNETLTEQAFSVTAEEGYTFSINRGYRVGKVGLICLQIRGTGTGTIAATKIGTVPEAYRPIGTYYFPIAYASESDEVKSTAYFMLNSDGTLSMAYPTTNTNFNIMLSAAYVCAN